MKIKIVSARAGDAVAGIEISDPDSPVRWEGLPLAARRWAETMGYGSAPDELLYVLAPDQPSPEGFPVLAVMMGNDRPVYPAPGSEIPGQPGYVVGYCGHRVAGSEWRAGLRTCERCPEADAPFPPNPGDLYPGYPGYVLGECGHRVPAGLRRCVQCPADAESECK